MTLTYLATPYSKYPGGLEAAHRDACLAAASLLRAGVNIYSPIAHTHAIAMIGGFDPTTPENHAALLAYDEVMLDRCDELIVVMMPGWERSKGIEHEVRYFTLADKPIRYVAWPDILTGPAPTPQVEDTRLVP